MKNGLMDTQDKLMLMRRSFIETIFSSIMSVNTWLHTKHRSPFNAMAHLIPGLIYYQLRDDIPSLQSILNLNPYTQLALIIQANLFLEN